MRVQKRVRTPLPEDLDLEAQSLHKAAETQSTQGIAPTIPGTQGGTIKSSGVNTHAYTGRAPGTADPIPPAP